MENFADAEIFSMSEDDIAHIALLERETFSDPWSEQALREELSNDNAVFFTVKADGKFAGYMGMHIILDECYVTNVAVKEKCRRKGLGRLLLSFAEKKAKERDCSFISLEVRVSNLPAIGLYEKEGYEEMGERKNFYSHPVENGLIMTKNLK